MNCDNKAAQSGEAKFVVVDERPDAERQGAAMKAGAAQRTSELDKLQLSFNAMQSVTEQMSARNTELMVENTVLSEMLYATRRKMARNESVLFVVIVMLAIFAVLK